MPLAAHVRNHTRANRLNISCSARDVLDSTVHSEVIGIKREQIDRTKRVHRSSILSPVAPPGAMMSISFESDEAILEKLRERLRRMTDEELIKFGKDVRRLAENPFQRQLDEARLEWKRRKSVLKATHD